MEEKKTVLLEVKAQMTEALKHLGELDAAIEGNKAKQQELKAAIRELEEAQRAGAISYEEAATAIASNKAQLIELAERQKAYRKEMGEQSRVVQNSIIAEEKYKGTLKGLCAELSVAKDKLRAMKLEDPGYKEQAKYVDELNTKVKELEAEYGVHTRNVGNYDGAVKSLRDDMRNLMDTIVGMKLEGKENTEEYRAASEKLAEYRDIMADTQQQTNELASDTKGLDTAMNGLMVGVSAVSMLGKVFDDGTEEGKKYSACMADLTKVVFALSAAQQIANKLQKQGVLVQTATKVQSLATVAAKKLEAKATAQATGATVAQTVAQTVLNAVMKANPILLIVSAIAALVAGLVGLFAWINRNTDAQKKAEQAQKDYEKAARQTEVTIARLTLQEKIHETAIREKYQDEMTQMMQSGATAEQIAKKKRELDEAVMRDSLKYSEATQNEERKAYQAALKNYEAQARYLNDLIRRKGADAKKTVEQRKVAEAAYDAYLQHLNAYYDAVKKFNDTEFQLAESAFTASSSAASKAYDRASKNLDILTKKRAEAYKKHFQYVYDETKTVEENAQLQARLQLQEAWNLFREQQRIAKEKLKIDRQYGKITADEYKQQLEILKAEEENFAKQHQENLKAYYRDVLKSVVSFAGQQYLEDQLEELEGNYKLAFKNLNELLEKGKISFEEFEFYGQSLAQEYEERKIKIREDAEKRTADLIKKQVDRIYEYDARQYSASEEEKLAMEIEQLREVVKRRKAAGLSTLEQEAQLATKEAQLRQAKLDRELQENWKNAKARFDIEKKYIEDELALEELAAERRAELEEQLADLISEHRQQQLDSMQEYADAAVDIFSSMNDILSGLDDAKVSKAEDDNAKQKASLDKRLKAGLISQRKYDVEVAALDEDLDKKKRKIAREQAIREKAMSAMQIGINTAAAIMKIWAEVPKADFGVSTGILTALAAATGAMQLAAVLATPLPQAGKGGRIEGPSHEQGGVLVNTEGDERIISANPSKAFPELLNLISYIGKHANIPDTGYAARAWAAENAKGQTQTPASAEPIDYDLLARKFGEQVVEGVKGIQVFTSLKELRDANDEQSRIENAAKM